MSEVSIEVEGRSVDEAIQKGLAELKLTLDQVSIDIVKETKGIFGIGRSATVRITKKDSPARDAESFLNGLSSFLLKKSPMFEVK